MKKNSKILSIAAILSLVFITGANAQGAYDAYRFSQQFNEGTARSVSMGNAFVALGGDLGAISINPASSGVYRYSEFVVTPSLTIANSSVNYLNNNISDSKTRFGVSNFGYVGSFMTGRENRGLINWNIALTFNKNNNFTSRMSASGRTAGSSWLASLAQSTNALRVHGKDLDITPDYDPFGNFPWNSILGWNTSLLDTLPDSPKDYIGATENIKNGKIGIGGELDQNYTRESTGNISEAVINFGGNISNKLFFGFNVGIQSIWYKYTDTYSETAADYKMFNTGFEHFTHRYSNQTSGTGVNLKFGLIYLPVKGLRLGASISTPTWMFLHDKYDESMSSKLYNFNDASEYTASLLSPLGAYDYRINTPFRWNVGAAYTFGKIGVISVDYENVNYSQMKLHDANDPNQFRYDNTYIKDGFTSSNIVRAGAEIMIRPEIALRAGYQYYSGGEKGYEKTETRQFGSLGLGYISKSGFFADITYQQQLKKIEEKFALYDDVYDGSEVVYAAPEGTNKWNSYKILVSVGFRF